MEVQAVLGKLCVELSTKAFWVGLLRWIKCSFTPHSFAQRNIGGCPDFCVRGMS